MSSRSPILRVGVETKFRYRFIIITMTTQNTLSKKPTTYRKDYKRSQSKRYLKYSYLYDVICDVERLKNGGK